MEIEHFKYNQLNSAFGRLSKYSPIVIEYLNLDNNSGYGYCRSLKNLYRHEDGTFSLISSSFSPSKKRSEITLMRFNKFGLCILNDGKCYGDLNKLLSEKDKLKIDFLQSKLQFDDNMLTFCLNY